MSNVQTGPRPSDRWIPWYFAAFFIALVSVLVPLSILAIRTHTGTITDQAYEKGLAYNHNIQAEHEQKSLNWRSELELVPQPSHLLASFYLEDADGSPLAADVTLWLVRPSKSGMDQKLAMIMTDKGRYEAEVSMPMNGLWEVRVAANAKGHNYQIVRRIVVP